MPVSPAVTPRIGFEPRYSMVTASRPISRAISSRRSESGVAIARANRSRHSSSLSAGKSGATIDGERLMRLTGMTSGIESPLKRAPAKATLPLNWDDLASAHRCGRRAREAGARPVPIGRSEVKNGRQSAAPARFLGLLKIRRDISYFFYASGKAFVIRCPLANMCVAYSSVAQR
jgi:hypothetical protein